MFDTKNPIDLVTLFIFDKCISDIFIPTYNYCCTPFWHQMYSDTAGLGGAIHVICTRTTFSAPFFSPLKQENTCMCFRHA